MITSILLLITATIIWGYAFVAAKWALEAFDPYWVNALRFGIAGVLSLPFLFYKKSFTRENHILKEALICSLFLFGILIFQTIGLTLTSVAKSGFITTLYALIIPVIMMIFFNKKFNHYFWFLVFLSILGMALMCNLEIHGLNLGDFFTFLCAISGAFHIIFVGKFAKSIKSAVEFNFLQNFFVGIIATIVALVATGPIEIVTPLQNPKILEGLLFLGIISSMLSFTIQVVAQRKIPEHIAGLIFLLESPFAALFGFLLLNERLSIMNIFGAFLIVISVVLVPFLEKKN